MIIIEEAKEFFCSGCGSKLGVIASDIKEGGQGSSEETDEQKKMRRYFTCPVCSHYNYLAKEDVPKISAKIMSDVNTYISRP